MSYAQWGLVGWLFTIATITFPFTIRDYQKHGVGVFIAESAITWGMALYAGGAITFYYLIWI